MQQSLKAIDVNPMPRMNNILAISNTVGPSSNAQFNPLPTVPGKCSKLKLHITFDDQLYVAGSPLKGRLELLCSSAKQVLLGEIAVELKATEEILDKEHATHQLIICKRIVFQGDRLPPSSAVRGQNRGGYYLANKGRTIFPFSFDLPKDSPCSYDFDGLARLRYQVTG